MSRSGIERAAWALAAAAALGLSLAGCSDVYFDRREAIAFGAGDAVAANAAEEMIDPWPAHSGQVTIASSGNKMQSAVERYRNNKVTAPVEPMAAIAPNQPQTAQGGSSGSSSSSSGSSQTSQASAQ